MNIDFLSDMDDVFLKSGLEQDVTYNGVAIKAVVFQDGPSVLQSRLGGGRELQSGTINQVRTNVIVSKSDVPIPNVNQDYIGVTERGAVRKMKVQSIKEEDPGSYTLVVG